MIQHGSKKLKILKTFLTFDGECREEGPLQRSLFIRLGHGCNVRCYKSSGYCDSPHSLDKKYPWPERTIQSLYEEAIQAELLGCQNVTITGGEPLLGGENLFLLADALGYHANMSVALETNGTIPISKQDIQTITSVVMDIKPPSTEVPEKLALKALIPMTNEEVFRRTDRLKFVIEDRRDYEWAKDILKKYPSDAKPFFGVRYGYLDDPTLVSWLDEDKLYNVGYNMQLHKILYPGSHPQPTKNLKEVNYERLAREEV